MEEEIKRPNIRPEWSVLEKILQIVCVLLLIVHLILLIKAWNVLPDNIPKHFGFAGKPDGYGSKSSLLFLPILSAVFYVLLTILERFPRIYNFSREITKRNAAFLYQAAREMLVCMKTEVLAVFLYVDFATVKMAQGAWNGLGWWLSIVFLIVLFGSMGFYINKMAKYKDPVDMI